MTGSGGGSGSRDHIAAVDIVKALSCIMIFLYHCNTILPGEWKFLTLFGQDLGNNLFFMVSGFALAPSIDSTPPGRFHIWYLKRLVRILPITFIAYALTFMRGYFSFRDPAQLFAVFIYPTLYWFITSILVFYIFLYLLGRYTGVRIRTAICLTLFIAYILLGERQERLYAAGFFSMLAGHMLRERIMEGFSGEMSAKLKKPAFAALLCSFVLYMTGELTDIAYISKGMIFAGAAGIGLSALLSGYLINDTLVALLGKKPFLRSFISYLGGMALPLYLVQCFCSGYIGFWIGLHIDFPLSFLVNFIVVWTAGTALYLIEKVFIKLSRIYIKI